MNILFFTRGEVSPYKGGTERITHTLSNALKTNYGHKCFTAYLRADSTSVVTEFDGSLHVNRFFVSRSIAKFVKQNTIECIIVQGEFYDLQLAAKTFALDSLSNLGSVAAFLNEEHDAHNPLSDSYVTMRFFKYLKERHNIETIKKAIPNKVKILDIEVNGSIY